jgi:hypothetical protein
MAIRIVRLGTARHPKEGLRIGTVRWPPRGVRKADYARRDYFDVWLPELAPSGRLVSWLLSEAITRSVGRFSSAAIGRKCSNLRHSTWLHCWRTCRRRPTFQWAVIAKAKATATGRS